MLLGEGCDDKQVSMACLFHAHESSSSMSSMDVYWALSFSLAVCVVVGRVLQDYALPVQWVGQRGGL